MRALLLAGVVAGWAGAAQATTIASNTAGSSSTAASYFGQSFTVVDAGSFTNIAVSFFDGRTIDPNVPLAVGNLYLLATEYTGPVSGLSTAPGRVGKAAAADNAYTFDATVVLSGGTKYFAYANDYATVRGTSANVYAGGNSYSSNLGNPVFVREASEDVNFQVSGTQVAVPEPASLALLGMGVAGIAAVRRRRAF